MLVDGASGGVGMAAVELAKAMGALVIAGVSVPEKKELPVAAGADRVLCYGRTRDSYRQFKTDVKEAAAALGRARAGGALRACEVYQVELAPYYATTRRSSAPFRGRRQAACPLLSGSIEKNCEDGVRSAA